MRFKQFITEKYLEGSRAPLYHWTSYLHLKNILQLDALGQSDKWDTMNGTTSLKKGVVSFTRDKNYRIRGKDSDVRFSFDPVILKQKGYKIIPYVDRSVINNIHDEAPLPRDKARWEAEEAIMGPIKLKDGLIKIEMTKDRYQDQEKLADKFEKMYKEVSKTAKEIKDGTFRWSIDYWEKNKKGMNLDTFYKPGGFVDKAKAELEKDPNWMPKGMSADSVEKGAENWKRMADEIKEMLKKVEILK